jgi:hypothetical protein
MTSPVHDAAAADASITADRDEIKYFVPFDRARALTQDIASHLAPHRYTGERANLLPGAHHFVTTIYFDTASHAHYRAASQNTARNVKVRAKEYYDLHPSLAELATSAAAIVRYQPWLFLELKHRDGRRTRKQRCRLRKVDVPSFFTRDVMAGEVDAARAAVDVASSELGEITAYCRELAEPLLASCLVNYRRLAFQDAHGALRVTADSDLAYFAAPKDLWTRSEAWVRGSLGAPRGIEQRALIEVKSRGPVPAWLQSSLDRAGATQVAFSKFVRAAQAVHGEL